MWIVPTIVCKSDFVPSKQLSEDGTFDGLIVVEAAHVVQTHPQRLDQPLHWVEGIIKSRPEPVQAPAKGFLGGRPCRKLATLQLYMAGKQVVANVSVAVQRQGLSVRRQMQVADGNYDSVPNETPAQIEAATTPEQNEGWWTESYDKALEHRILQDLYKALHGPAER